MNTPKHHCTLLNQDERLSRFRLMGDPLADAAALDLMRLPKREGQGDLLNAILENGIESVPDAPESWKELFHQVDHIPYWVNWSVMNQASQVFLKTGLLGMLTLGCYVTPLFYRLSRGNKALSFSGDLHKRAGRRGRETARFVIETCMPHNLQRDADGFKVTLRVRLIHAYVRAMILKSGRWDMEQYGMPISQSYMAAMNALLSMGWIEGLKHLGFRLSREEEESIIQLWRYSAYLSGIDSELHFGSFQEARHFWCQILKEEPPPDGDSRQLIDSILTAIPEAFDLQGRSFVTMHSLCRGLAYSMIGEELGRDLNLVKTPWRHATFFARRVVPIWRWLGQRSATVRRWSQYYGTTLWLNQSEFAPQGGLEMFAPRSRTDES